MGFGAINADLPVDGQIESGNDVHFLLSKIKVINV